MSQSNLRDHVKGFYGQEFLPPGTADRLEALAEVDRSGSGRSAPLPIAAHWPYRVFALAACVALILSGTSLYVAVTRDTQVPVVEVNPPALDGRVVNGPFTDPNAAPQLVMVKFQIDGCPLAAAVEPTFADLMEKYGDKPVVFARYDMTTEIARRQSNNLACSLGIDWACEGPYQSGMIKLIDTKRQAVLSTLTDGNQMADMERVLARALPAGDPANR